MDRPSIPSSTGMNLTSPAFEHGTPIPRHFTCQGVNSNPPLHISDVPTEAKSLALIMDDPDAPGGTYVHWLFWNLDPRTEEILEDDLHAAAAQGTNSARIEGYIGPCPPSGEHRYFFKLYALDAELGLAPGAYVQDLAAAMEGHIIEECELMGRYAKENGA